MRQPRQSAVTRPHLFLADTIRDYRGRPLCATCALPKDVARHLPPVLPDGAAEVQARIVGEAP